MAVSIQHVPVEFIAQTWPLVEKHIGSAQQFGGDDYTTDQVKVYLSKGLWKLFAAVNEENMVQGAATVLFQNYPNDRVAFVTTMGGDMLVNEEVLHKFKQELKKFGATKLQGAMRPSMVRLSEKLGFVERYAIVEVKI
jgi:hypothetical protein